MEPVFLTLLVDQLTGFVQVSALTMIQHLFLSYGAIDKIDLRKHSVNIMVPYDPAETLALLVEKLESGRYFALEGGQIISNTIMVSKGITLLT